MGYHVDLFFFRMDVFVQFVYLRLFLSARCLNLVEFSSFEEQKFFVGERNVTFESIVFCLLFFFGFVIADHLSIRVK